MQSSVSCALCRLEADSETHWSQPAECRFFGKALPEVCGFILAFEAMILDFKIIVPFSENLLELEGLRLLLRQNVAKQKI